jgi:hypothetical protein
VTNTSAGIGYRNAAADPSKVEDASPRTTAEDEGQLARDDYEREWQDGDTLQDAVVTAERRRKAARHEDEKAFEDAYRDRKDDDA